MSVPTMRIHPCRGPLTYYSSARPLPSSRTPQLRRYRSGFVAAAVPEEASAVQVDDKSKSEGQSSATRSIFTTQSFDDDDDTGGDCQVFINRDGDMVPILCCDYGFRSGAARMYSDADGKLPTNGLQLGIANFQKELEALRRSFRYDEYSKISALNPANSTFGRLAYSFGSGLRNLISNLDKTLEDGKLLRILKPEEFPAEQADGNAEQIPSSCQQVQTMLATLRLSNKAVWDREHKREATGAGVDTPWFVRGVYLALCLFLDFFFENRPIQRFWFLETVARMPYFSYISVLHLYESLGWWRAGAELRKVHFAEEWNELHHLQIMESLGGDQLWVDRFVAQHAAIVYYFILVAMYIAAPTLAYNFSELIEAHAVDTYGEFADANKATLKQLPPPIVAAAYYSSQDLYMFDEFQTSEKGRSRRPACNNLYDVFCNIRDDEGEHVKTMKACQDMTVVRELADRRQRGRRV